MAEPAADGRRCSRLTVVSGAAVVTVGGAVAAYALFGRRRQLHCGATDEETRRSLPGDELIADADLVATRGITVHTTAERVWPWIAQLGQGRGGFYSYDALENLAGCHIHSADRILPALQAIQPGDEVRLAPAVALQVAAVDPGRSLVLSGGVTMGAAPPPYDFSWAFVLTERPDGTTRLVARERYGYKRLGAALLVEPVEVVSFVMSRKMLRGIRDRAETGAADPTATLAAVSAAMDGSPAR